MTSQVKGYAPGLRWVGLGWVGMALGSAAAHPVEAHRRNRRDRIGMEFQCKCRRWAQSSPVAGQGQWIGDKKSVARVETGGMWTGRRLPLPGNDLPDGIVDHTGFDAAFSDCR